LSAGTQRLLIGVKKARFELLAEDDGGNRTVYGQGLAQARC